VTVADVAGGLPETVVPGCGTPATYGVTVYEVIGEPPSDGAVHVTEADPFPADAVTAVGAPGTVGGAGFSCTIAATDGTPSLLRMNSM
jgi:hypothetical protein